MSAMWNNDVWDTWKVPPRFLIDNWILWEKLDILFLCLLTTGFFFLNCFFMPHFKWIWSLSFLLVCVSALSLWKLLLGVLLSLQSRLWFPRVHKEIIYFFPFWVWDSVYLLEMLTLYIMQNSAKKIIWGFS